MDALARHDAPGLAVPAEGARYNPAENSAVEEWIDRYRKAVRHSVIWG